MLTSDELVELIETKLTKIGIAKVVPDPDVLAPAYRRAYQVGLLNRALAAAADDARRQAAEIDVPDLLVERVRAYLKEHPEEPWDAAIASLAGHALSGAGRDALRAGRRAPMPPTEIDANRRGHRHETRPHAKHRTGPHRPAPPRSRQPSADQRRGARCPRAEHPPVRVCPARASSTRGCHRHRGPPAPTGSAPTWLDQRSGDLARPRARSRPASWALP